jgi:HEAT repeat protein
MIPALKVLETMPVNKDRAKALLSLRSSYDPELHRRARIEIKRLGRQAIGPLLQLIQPENEVFYRKHATYFLGELRAASAVPDLLKMLNDEDEDLREYAATALGKIGDPTAVPALIHLLSDIITTYPSPERLVCQSAVDALEQIGTPAAVQAMQAWRHDPVPFFINGLQSPLVKLRRKQAWTLYKYPQKSVVKTLIDALEDPDSEVRRGAAWSLGQIGDSDAVQPLLNILPSASRIVCATVIMALGSLRAAEAIPVITEYLSDTRTYHHNQRISDAAAEALRKIKQV